MRLARSFVVLAAAVAVVLGFAVGPADARMKISGRNLGVHSFTTKPLVPAGTLRMNCSPMWRVTEPARGVYKWQTMDMMVARAESWGFTDIEFTFCGTPQWAGGPVARPQSEVLGPGSTAAPKNMQDWRDFATAVVKRYKGRIDSYQAWNEITSPQFYQGTSGQMASMTKDLWQIVNKYDPNALVVAGSVQTHVPTLFNSMAVPYFRALKQAGWPVDVTAGHFYPIGKGGPNERVAQILMFRRALAKLQYPRSKQQWDTEGNFWVGVPGNNPAGRVRGTRAAIFVSRNFLDAWRLGLTRSYWYLWSDKYFPFAGVQLRTGDAGSRAYQTLGAWTIGATLGTCSQKGRLVTCGFSKAGKRFVVAYTTQGRAKLKIAGSKPVCPVTGGKCRSAKKKAVITALPVKIG